MANPTPDVMQILERQLDGLYLAAMTSAMPRHDPKQVSIFAGMGATMDLFRASHPLTGIQIRFDSDEGATFRGHNFVTDHDMPDDQVEIRVDSRVFSRFSITSIEGEGG